MGGGGDGLGARIAACRMGWTVELSEYRLVFLSVLPVVEEVERRMRQATSQRKATGI